MALADKVVRSLPKEPLVFDLGSEPSDLVAWFVERSCSVYWFNPIESALRDSVALEIAAGPFEKIERAKSISGVSHLVDGIKDYELRSIDDASYGLCAPDFIKLDGDGCEELVLGGGVRVITAHHPPIMLKLSASAKSIGMRPEGALEKLYALGYKAHAMDGAYCAKSMEEAMRYFPWNSSYNVMMLHKDFKYD